MAFRNSYFYCSRSNGFRVMTRTRSTRRARYSRF